MANDDSVNGDDLPGDWFEIEPVYPFQRKLWRNGATGNVLVIEEKQEPWHDDDEGPDLNVLLLEQEHQIAPDPLDTILDAEKEPAVALREAREAMADAPGSSD